MKYVVFLADGCADRPIDKLNGKTPLEVAKTPCMDFFANNGKLILVKTVPDKMKPGSDVANLSVMGFDPKKYYTGRSPLEASSIGVNLSDRDTSFRANFVTLSNEENYEDKTMLDYSAGEISSQEGKELMEAVEKELSKENMHFYPGVSYRNLFVWNNADKDILLTPPHDITGRKIKEYIPNNKKILDIMKKSSEIFKNHPINIKRRKEGKNEATSLWIWGEGTKPQLSSFEEEYGLKGAVISAVDLIKGIAKLTNMDSIDVKGATGTVKTNFDGKANAAVKALLEDNKDFVYIHMEAPDECGHQRDLEGKIKSLELIDEKVIKKVWDALEKSGEDYKIVVLPDHPTPIEIATHAPEPVPCVIYRKGDNNNSNKRFTEKDAAECEYIEDGSTLMRRLINE